ncbi:hypothetical protein [Streptomyces sp. NPDC006638]|uniref:hypothetical protein n=1 Tax=Streptomyces sp. NPDC006638 TaxID=3157183 RepID=UPI0033A388A0
MRLAESALDGAALSPGSALTEMVRVVRPGGVIGVVHRAPPLGAGPMFVPLARAIERLDDPDVGTLGFPVFPAYLERPEIEGVLLEAGCTDVRSETVVEDSPVPAPEAFLSELDPFFRMFPPYRAATVRHADRFRAPAAEEVRRMERGENDHPLARADIAYGRAPR